MAAIMGTHPWLSPWEVWAQKAHGAAGRPDAPELAMGRDLEGVVLSWAATMLGAQLGEGVPLRHPTAPLGGNPDGWVFMRDQTIGIEAKTARYPDVWGEAPNGEIPPGYYDQVQTYMLCSDTTDWIVAVWFLGNYQRRIYNVRAAAERQAAIVETCSTWWQRHVVGGEPPEIDASDACRDHLAQGQHNGRLRIATDAEVRLALDLRAVEDSLAALDQDRAHLRNQIRAAIGPDEGFRWAEGRVTHHRPSGRITVRIR